MELKVKSLQGSTFTISAEPSESIGELKSKIETAHGHATSSQKIIFSGKILTDADTVQSCGVSEKDFLVLMVSKPKAAKTPAAATSSASATEAPKQTVTPATSAPAQPEAAPSVATPKAAAETSEQPPTASGPPGSSQFLTGSALEDAVNNIVEMGFEKSEVQRAMRASFNNPERAVEYLMTGIPEHLNQPAPSAQPAAGGQATATPAPATTGSQGESQPSTQAPSNTRSGNLFEAAAAQAQGGDAGGRPRGGGGDGMDALRDLGEDDGNGNTALDLGNPAMLAQLRQLVQQNPAALAPLVQALAQSNPQLANAMTEDPEGVLNLLASGAAGGLGGEGEEDVALPSLSELNPEDRTAVEQIVAMGIEENRAIEVYLMCGRNVEMAVQYYFENPQDFED